MEYGRVKIAKNKSKAAARSCRAYLRDKRCNLNIVDKCVGYTAPGDATPFLPAVR